MPELIQNEGQIAAIQHRAGPMLVLAGPGSGKTYVITHRIVHLISECKIPPNNILVITFTKAAAMEMQARAVSLTKQCAYVQFGTFHSVFYQIFNLSHTDHRLTLVSDRERFGFVKAVLCKNDQPKVEKETDDKVQKCLKEISRRKNLLPCSQKEDTSDEKMTFIYGAYQEWLSENQKLDFDDMLRLCYEYLLENPAERKQWQKRFQYILIDEFQDINLLQYETVKLLSGNQNLFAVGDDDQAIYSFRGSDPMIMRRFVREFSVKPIRLHYNYRCSGNITKMAAGLIGHNQKRFQKQIIAIKEAGEEVQIKAFPGRKEEHIYLGEETLRYGKENTEKTQAVLVRTNGMVDVYRQLLGGTGEQENSVGEDLLAYLLFINCGRKREDFLKIMNKPVRYISRNILLEQTVDFSLLQKRLADKPWIRNRVAELEKQIAFAMKMDLGGQLHYIWNVMGYEQYVLDCANGDYRKIKEVTNRFTELLAKSKTCKTLEQLKNIKEEGKEIIKNEKLSIMTYHGAKGLEFDRVYLPDLCYGKVPHGRMLSAEELEEERRMFYVAMTRAKESLFLLYPKEQTVSPFLTEIIS